MKIIKLFAICMACTLASACTNSSPSASTRSDPQNINGVPQPTARPNVTPSGQATP